MKIKIKYSDDAIFVINITDQMIKDWREHCKAVSSLVVGGKKCDTCSLNVDMINGYGICEMEKVRDELNRLARMDAKKDLEMYKRKLKRLKDLKEKEPDNTYHDWDAEIAQCEHNMADCVCELD